MNVKTKEGEIATEDTEVTEEESHARTERRKARKEDKPRPPAAVTYICLLSEQEKENGRDEGNVVEKWAIARGRYCVPWSVL